MLLLLVDTLKFDHISMSQYLSHEILHKMCIYICTYIDVQHEIILRLLLMPFPDRCICSVVYYKGITHANYLQQSQSNAIKVPNNI